MINTSRLASILRVGVMVISTTDVFVSFSVRDANNSNITFDDREIGVLDFG